MTRKTVHPNSAARDRAIQFLYQCETEKLFHFSEGHFNTFANNFGLDPKTIALVKTFAEGVLENLILIDRTIERHSQNWTLVRMPTTDRCILRVATFELLKTGAPKKVAINEAIDLAKKYGTTDSGSFVNAILDQVASEFSSAP